MPQMPVRATRIRTSLIPMEGSGTSCSQRPSSARDLTRAFTVESYWIWEGKGELSGEIAGLPRGVKRFQEFSLRPCIDATRRLRGSMFHDLCNLRQGNDSFCHRSVAAGGPDASECILHHAPGSAHVAHIADRNDVVVIVDSADACPFDAFKRRLKSAICGIRSSRSTRPR